MYADDTAISFSSDNIEEIDAVVNAELACLEKWLQGNKLSLNVVKTQAMIPQTEGHPEDEDVYVTGIDPDHLFLKSKKTKKVTTSAAKKKTATRKSPIQTRSLTKKKNV